MAGREPSVRELEAALQRAEAELAAVTPSAEHLRAEAAAVEQQAQVNGKNAKTSAVVESMRRRWASFVELLESFPEIWKS